LLGIHWERELLYQRIDKRVDERIQEGMIQEVQSLLASGMDHERLDALGLEYRFVSRLLRGEFASEAEMVQRLKYAIHDFTRRQLTWFRRDKRIFWITGHEGSNGDSIMVEEADQLIQSFLSHNPKVVFTV
jgi:tRNA dimethylallyltransferase